MAIETIPAGGEGGGVDNSVVLQSIEDNTDGIETAIGTTNSTLSDLYDTEIGAASSLVDVSAKLDAAVADLDQIATSAGTSDATLSTIDANTADLHGDLLAINGHVDGLEGLIGTTNSTLTTIDGHVDGLEVSATATNTKLDTLHTDLGHATDGTAKTSVVASSSDGYTITQAVSAASTNATSLKGSAGKVGMIIAANTNASPRYLKLYNKATAPTVGTDTPVMTCIIPGSTTVGAGTNIPVPTPGLDFPLGIAFAITTGLAVTDTGAVGAADVVVSIGYK